MATMRISAAILRLQELQKQHGDVDVECDCPYCGRSFAPTTVVAAPVVATLVRDVKP